MNTHKHRFSNNHDWNSISLEEGGGLNLILRKMYVVNKQRWGQLLPSYLSGSLSLQPEGGILLQCRGKRHGVGHRNTTGQLSWIDQMKTFCWVEQIPPNSSFLAVLSNPWWPRHRANSTEHESQKSRVPKELHCVTWIWNTVFADSLIVRWTFGSVLLHSETSDHRVYNC